MVQILRNFFREHLNGAKTFFANTWTGRRLFSRTLERGEDFFCEHLNGAKTFFPPWKQRVKDFFTAKKTTGHRLFVSKKRTGRWVFLTRKTTGRSVFLTRKTTGRSVFLTPKKARNPAPFQVNFDQSLNSFLIKNIELTNFIKEAAISTYFR